MKKLSAVLLAAIMIFSFSSCGKKNEAPDIHANTNTYTNPDVISDVIVSEDGKYEIALVTDYASIKDKSFNQAAFDGVKLYAANRNYSYAYYIPANGNNATDTDRYEAMKNAVENGAKVVVCCGSNMGGALEQITKDYPKTGFIFIDGWSLGLDNACAVSFKEEQSGFLAGYAVVKDGYTKLGFAGGGGGENPACNKYGYGFAQGAAAAAKEMGVEVELLYSFLYGEKFNESDELLAMVSDWYQNGTEVIFSCGGPMLKSVVTAAEQYGGKVVGVDSDQSHISETIITSAMKGINNATQWTIDKFFKGEFKDITGDKPNSLGAEEFAVGLPTENWRFNTFTINDYESILDEIHSGKTIVDDDYSELSSNVNLHVIIID